MEQESGLGRLRRRIMANPATRLKKIREAKAALEAEAWEKGVTITGTGS